MSFKFKYKYIDNINWKYDDLGSREYYDSLKYGREIFTYYVKDIFLIFL